MSNFVNYTNRKQYQTYRAQKAKISPQKAKISLEIFVENFKRKKKFYCVDTNTELTMDEFLLTTGLDKNSLKSLLNKGKESFEENGNQLIFQYNGFIFKKL
jgi:hypothetical protein